MTAINWMDCGLILLLALGMLLGYAQGLLRQMIALAALYLGAILATQYFTVLGGVLKGILPTTPGPLLNDIAFFIILFAVVVILSYLAHDAYNVNLRLIPWLNHLGGMVLGLLAAWIVLTLAVNVLTFTTGLSNWSDAEPVRQTLRHGLEGSVLAKYSTSTFPTLIAAIKPWLPRGLPRIFNM